MKKIPQATLQLGISEGAWKEKSCRISGGDAESAGSLPEYLLGARLDSSSFAMEPGAAGSSWSARWRGPGDGDGVRVSWNPEAGWMISADWQGKLLVSGGGFRDCCLADALCRALRYLPSAVEDRLSASAGGSPPFFFTRTPPLVTNVVSAPDGCFMDLSIPLEFRSCPRAAELFRELPRLGLPCAVAGAIYLCRCRVARRNLPGRAIGLGYADSVSREDGLPFADRPLYSFGTVRFVRSACVLRVTVPWHAVEAVLGHFSEVARQGAAGKPFLLGTPFSRTLEAAAFHSGDETARWMFGGDWRQAFPPRKGTDSPACFAAAVKRALAEIGVAAAPDEGYC